MIPLRDQDLIRRRFADQIGGAVRLDHFTQPSVDLIVPGRDPCPTCDDASAVMRELAALSGRIRLTEHQISRDEMAGKLGVHSVPATVVRGPNNRALKLYGLPAGSLFPVFLETIIAASHGGFEAQRNGVALALTTKQRLKRLRDDVRMVVFVTPTCPYSPQMALMAFALGIESHRIRPEVIVATEFPRLVQRHSIKGVPTIVLDDDTAVAGGIDEAGMIDEIVRAAKGRGRTAARPTSPYFTPLEPPSADAGAAGPQHRSPSGLILP